MSSDGTNDCGGGDDDDDDDDVVYGDTHKNNYCLILY